MAGPDADNAIRYTGREQDATGLYYYRARYYQPAWGRFLQTDPVGYKDDINAYMFVHNDPSDLTDPMGLTTYDCTSPSSCPGRMLLKDLPGTGTMRLLFAGINKIDSS